MRDALPAAQDLARRLVEHEAATAPVPAGAEQAALRVLEKLQALLSRLVGTAGFRSLLNRALALAQRETPWLATVDLKDNATLARFGDGAPSPALVAQGALQLVAQFLALLYLFIGTGLTLRLVRDVWPDVPLDDLQPEGQETPR